MPTRRHRMWHASHIIFSRLASGSQHASKLSMAQLPASAGKPCAGRDRSSWAHIPGHLLEHILSFISVPEPPQDQTNRKERRRHKMAQQVHLQTLYTVAGTCQSWREVALPKLVDAHWAPCGAAQCQPQFSHLNQLFQLAPPCKDATHLRCFVRRYQCKGSTATYELFQGDFPSDPGPRFLLSARMQPRTMMDALLGLWRGTFTISVARKERVTWVNKARGDKKHGAGKDSMKSVTGVDVAVLRRGCLGLWFELHAGVQAWAVQKVWSGLGAVASVEESKGSLSTGYRVDTGEGVGSNGGSMGSHSSGTSSSSHHSGGGNLQGDGSSGRGEGGSERSISDQPGGVSTRHGAATTSWLSFLPTLFCQWPISQVPATAQFLASSKSQQEASSASASTSTSAPAAGPSSPALLRVRYFRHRFSSADIPRLTDTPAPGRLYLQDVLAWLVPSFLVRHCRRTEVQILQPLPACPAGPPCPSAVGSSADPVTASSHSPCVDVARSPRSSSLASATWFSPAMSPSGHLNQTVGTVAKAAAEGGSRLPATFPSSSASCNTCNHPHCRPDSAASPATFPQKAALPPGFRVVEYSSVIPYWNCNLGTWCLNFHQRVRLASVKNMQLGINKTITGASAPQHDLSQLPMQFGKVEDDTYTLDFNPSIMTTLQAFAVALSTFGRKTTDLP